MAAGATSKVAPKPSPKKDAEESKTIKRPEPEEKKIARADIMKMNVATVRAYAESQGIKGANAMSGAELKRILGDRLFEESADDTDADTETETE
jgi:hypothetical protein